MVHHLRIVTWIWTSLRSSRIPVIRFKPCVRHFLAEPGVIPCGGAGVMVDVVGPAAVGVALHLPAAGQNDGHGLLARSRARSLSRCSPCTLR